MLSVVETECPVEVLLRFVIVCFIQFPPEIYSFIASSPKAKKQNKRRLLMGTAHQVKVIDLLSCGGIAESGY
jgi:hypothetical protein